MAKQISFIAALLWCSLLQSVEINFDQLQSHAIAFAERINRKQPIPEERIVTAIDRCILNGKPYRYRDLYLSEKPAPKLREEKLYLIDSFSEPMEEFFRSCSDIYNDPAKKGVDRVSVSILLEMVSAPLDKPVAYKESTRKALQEWRKEN